MLTNFFPKDNKTVFSNPTYLNKNGEQTDDTVFYEKFSITKKLTGTSPKEIDIRYQLCLDDGTCLVPTNETFLFQESKKNILWMILISFLAGLLLNLSPCILPIIGIKFLTLINFAKSNKRSRFIDIGYYIFGVLISFFILSLVVVILKLTGSAVGWGFQYQNRYYILFTIFLMFAFALNFLGVFTIPHLFNYNEKSSFSSFLLGTTAVILGSACSIPFLGTAVAFALTQDNITVILIFFSIGVGFASPFLFFGIFPSLYKKLPKSGEWLGLTYKILGFLFFGVIIWLLGILIKQNVNINVVLFSLLIFAFLISLYQWKIKNRFIKKIIIPALVVLTMGSVVYLIKPTQNLDPQHSIKSSVSLPISGLQNFLSENENVLVEVTAEWCLTCKFNRLTVLSSLETESKFRDLSIKLYLLDYTNSSEKITAYINSFGSSGVPLYVLYKKGKVAQPITGYLFKKSFITKLEEYYK